MSSAREQARRAGAVGWNYDDIDLACEAAADAASDVWEAVLRDIIQIASTGYFCASDAAVVKRAQEALGE